MDADYGLHARLGDSAAVTQQAQAHAGTHLLMLAEGVDDGRDEKVHHECRAPEHPQGEEDVGHPGATIACLLRELPTDGKQNTRCAAQGGSEVIFMEQRGWCCL